MNFDFNQYVGKQVDVSLLEHDTTITSTLRGVNDYGVFLSDSKEPTSTFGARFYPWSVIEYIDLSREYTSRAA